jgi:hypothetical protein
VKVDAMRSAFVPPARGEIAQPHSRPVYRIFSQLCEVAPIGECWRRRIPLPATWASLCSRCWIWLLSWKFASYARGSGPAAKKRGVYKCRPVTLEGEDHQIRPVRAQQLENPSTMLGRYCSDTLQLPSSLDPTGTRRCRHTRV